MTSAPQLQTGCKTLGLLQEKLPFLMKNLYLRIFSLGSTYTIGNLLQQALAIFLLPLYTSYLSLADFGILALMELTIFLINRPIVTPFLGAFARFYYKPEYEERNGEFLFSLFSILFVKTLLFTGIYWLSSDFLSTLLFEDSQAYIHIIQVYTLILLFQPLSMFLLQLIRTREMAKFFVFISLSKVILVTGVTVYLLTALELGVLAVIYGTIAGLVFEVTMALPVLLKNSTFKISRLIINEPLRYGYPMLLSGYSNILIESGDRYLLNILVSVSSVGLYSFGYKLSRVINLLLVVPLKQSVGPIIYQREKNPKEQRRLIVSVATYFYLVGIFMALGLSVLAREVIMLLATNPEFWAAWTIVPIITLSYVQLGLGGFLNFGIILKNKSQYISGTVLVGAAVNIGLNLIFIPYWGILGAAFATLISYVTLNGLYAYYSAKFYDLHFELGRLGYITLVGVGVYLVSLLVANTGSLPFDIITKLLILLIYPLTFFVTRFFTPLEKAQLQTLWQQGFKVLARQTELPIQ